jgi:hypothetical protein
VANKPKRALVKDRRARVEELRRQQRAAERRKTTIFIVIASVVGLAILAVAIVPLINEARQNDRPYTDFGVSAAEAQCDAVTSDPVETANHVEGSLQYTTIPATGGDHSPDPSAPPRNFFTADDAYPVERLVHHMEHGYTVLWYDSTIGSDQLQTIEDLVERVRDDGDRRKFIAAPWDESRGAFPEGKHVALTHWSAEGEGAGAAGVGHRLICGQVSGESVDQFMTQFPFSDAREPNAA